MEPYTSKNENLKGRDDVCKTARVSGLNSTGSGERPVVGFRKHGNKFSGLLKGVKILEICGLLGYYAVLSDSSLPKFRDNPSVPFYLVPLIFSLTTFRYLRDWSVVSTIRRNIY
jgi:hypothetical protein